MIKFCIICFLGLSIFLFAQEDSELETAINYELSKKFKDDGEYWNMAVDKQSSTIVFHSVNDFYKNAKIFYPKYIHILLKYKKYVNGLFITVSKSEEDKLLQYIQGISNQEIFDNESYLDNIIKIENSSSDDLIFKFTLKDISDAEDAVEADKAENITIPKIYNDENFIKEKLKKTSDPITEKKITLRDYIVDVLVSNPTINEKYEYVMSLQQDILKAKASLLPKVDINYGYTHYSVFKANAPEKDKDMTKDITMKYNIFNGFKDKNNIDIKFDYYKANSYTKDQVEDETIYSVVDAYITLQKTLYLYDLSRQNYMDYMNFVSKAEIKFQNGVVSLKNYSKIQARVITRYVNFEEDTKRYSDAITTLQKYIDFDDSFVENLKAPNPKSKYFDNLLLALEDCKKLSPYVKEAETNVRLYKKKMLNVKNIFMPTVDLVAKKSITSNYFEGNIPMDQTKETSFAFTGKMNIYNGGSDQAEYKMKLFDYRSKLHKRDSVIKDTVFNVDMDFNKLVLQEAKQSFYKELVERRTQEYVAAKYDYKFTKIDANGLLDELDSLYNAQRQFAENEFDIISTKYKILKDIGVIKQNILDEE